RSTRSSCGARSCEAALAGPAAVVALELRALLVGEHRVHALSRLELRLEHLLVRLRHLLVRLARRLLVELAASPGLCHRAVGRMELLHDLPALVEELALDVGELLALLGGEVQSVPRPPAAIAAHHAGAHHAGPHAVAARAHAVARPVSTRPIAAAHHA